MDALMCDEGSPWDPNPETRRDADAMCRAVSRVLRKDGVEKGGVFIMISFAQPHFRRRYLEAFEEEVQSGGAVDAGLVKSYRWRVNNEAFGEAGCLETFLYVCVKED